MESLFLVEDIISNLSFSSIYSISAASYGLPLLSTLPNITALKGILISDRFFPITEEVDGISIDHSAVPLGLISIKCNGRIIPEALTINSTAEFSAYMVLVMPHEW